MKKELKRPRIGIIGTGAIGGFYGVMLARAGFDVHFLLRSEFEAVMQDGLRIDSEVHGELLLKPVQAYSAAADMPPCDWLLVGAKSTGNVELAPAIIQAAAPDAKVLVLQNGLAVEDSLREALPDSLHLLGGLCFISVYRSGPGNVVHQAFGRVNLGYHSGPVPTDEARQLIVEQGAGLFHAAGLESEAMANLAQARWQKLVWNIPYNGLSTLLRATTTPLMGDPQTRELIQALMAEVVQGAQACGHELPAGYAQSLFAMTQTMPDYRPSMYLDYQERRPLELQAIYAEPLAAALQAGCDMVRVRMLHQALTFLDAGNH
jgi:2-dehydropantoate 2-reductase